MQSRVFRASAGLLIGMVKLTRDLEKVLIDQFHEKQKFAETMVCVYQTGFEISVQGKLFTFLVQPKWLHCSQHSIWPFNPVFY